MSNNMKLNEKHHQWLSNIDSLNFGDKSVLIIGAGWMASQYAKGLTNMNIKDVTVSSRSKEKIFQLCKEFGFKPAEDGIDPCLSSSKKFDLIIIATNVDSLLPNAKLAIEKGHSNILIEKPGSLYSEKLLSFAKEFGSQKVRIAFNRLLYPNLLTLKHLAQEEGGITSCLFTFTEWINTIDFNKESQEVYQRWGIANSLHVISMAYDLIGMPREFSTHCFGKLDWHPTGSIFVGGGITENNIPFSYHADWNSAGRWGIEVNTNENSYRLIPLEDLYVCHKGSVTWEKVSFKIPFPNVKQGVAEEIASMLDDTMQKQLPSLENTASFIRVAEKIFGYDR